MRIISGLYKGRRLLASPDLSIRPTTSRIKEVIFNVLQDFPQGRNVTDIFAGSGNLGIEALSRGAEHVNFVEKSTASISVLKKNLMHLQILPSSYTIIQEDAITFVEKYSIESTLILIDPPFHYPQLQTMIDALFANSSLKDRAIVILEHEINNPLQKMGTDYTIFQQKKKGRSLISFIEKRSK